MDDTEASALMQRFGKAFFSRDRASIASLITEDAEWHFAMGPDAPHGSVRKGIDGFMRGIEANDALFERLKFGEVQCRGMGADQLVMTYVVDGKFRDGDAFTLRGIELVTARDGRVAKKDVFWKQVRA